MAIRQKKLFFGSFLGMLLTVFHAAAADVPVAGWVENVTIYPGSLRLKAKLDTGALTSSLDVPRFERYRSGEKDWVRFSLTDFEGHSAVIDRPIVRIAKIKRPGSTRQERVVVVIGVCLGATFEEIEVTLNDRTGFNYQLLLGRKFLSGKFLVDSSRTFLLETRCPNPPSK